MEEKTKLSYEICQQFDMVEREVITFNKAKDNVRLFIEGFKVNECVIPIAGKNQPTSTIHRLGVATTIGELRKMIENYPDDTSFGFRNQPIQELYEVKHPDVMCIVFQEKQPETFEANLIRRTHSELNHLLDQYFIEGLKRKGYEFQSRYDLEAFIKSNCNCEDDLFLEKRTYFVNGVPFLVHFYNPNLTVSANFAGEFNFSKIYGSLAYV